MPLSLIEKARANRRAALASLNAREARSQNVVSIFDGVIQHRKSVPEFHSIRIHMDAARPTVERGNPLVA